MTVRGRDLAGAGCFPTGTYYPGVAHLLGPPEGLDPKYQHTTPIAELPVVAVDIETTGLTESDRIIEVACVAPKGKKAWLVDPGIPIPAESTAVHGITNEDVRGKPTIGEVAHEVQAALTRHGVPLAYNAGFDEPFLRRETRFSGEAVVWVDPLIWARFLFPRLRSRGLANVAKHLGFVPAKAHRALDDAETTLKVWKLLVLDQRMPKTYGALIREQRRLAIEQGHAMARRGLH